MSCTFIQSSRTGVIESKEDLDKFCFGLIYSKIMQNIAANISQSYHYADFSSHPPLW